MSTTLELDDDGEGVQKGLLTLVLSLVDIIDEALEKEAVRRMESGELTDEEIERLGAQLKQLSAEIERLKQQEGVDESVDEFRGQLDTLVADAITDLSTSTEHHE